MVACAAATLPTTLTRRRTHLLLESDAIARRSQGAANRAVQNGSVVPADPISGLPEIGSFSAHVGYSRHASGTHIPEAIVRARWVPAFAGTTSQDVARPLLEAASIARRRPATRRAKFCVSTLEPRGRRGRHMFTGEAAHFIDKSYS